MKEKIFKYLFLFSLFCFSIGSLAIVLVFTYFSFTISENIDLSNYQPDVTSRVYSSNGILLKEYANEKRIFTSIEDIPEIVKKAFISAEDKNFYKNNGIDPKAIISATIYNFFAYFKNKQFRGGSTITQQVVKNMILNNERTISRKIKEAILSYKITKSLDKEKILELYLNHIYLGNNSYGVTSACLSYFNKQLKDIEPEEAALLAAMPKAPGKLNPFIKYNEALNRRNWVLERMKKDNYITVEEYENAIKKPINLSRREKNKKFNYGSFIEEVRKKLAIMYTEESLMKDGFVVSTTIDPKIQKELDNALKNGLENYDMRHGYRRSLGNIYNKDFKNKWPELLKNFKIEEYYRNNWQRAVVLYKNLEKSEVVIGLLINEKDDKDIKKYDNLVDIENIKAKTSYIKFNNLKWAIDPDLIKKIKREDLTLDNINLKIGDIIFVEATENNGYILKQTPQVNGAAVALDPHTGRVLAMVGGYIDSEITFNRATQAKRQPGSSIKPFVYLTAFENGYNPANTIMDDEIVLSQGSNLPNYRPRNFSGTYHGLITLRTALQNSYNVATVRLVSELGIGKVTNTIKKFEINKKPKRVYSVVLGSVETYLIDMVKAYSMLVNGGKYIDIEIIEKIQDKNGKTIFKRDKRLCKKCIVTKDDVDNIEVPFLDDNRKSISDEASTYQVISILEGTVNNGTASRAKSIGKIIGGKTGTTNDFRDAWFIGFTPDIVIGVYVGFDDNRSLGENETGSRTALPIFVEAAKKILRNETSIPFRVPENIILKRIDTTTGQAPTLISKDKNIIFEAFKTNDKNLESYDLKNEIQYKEYENYKENEEKNIEYEEYKKNEDLYEEDFNNNLIF